MFITKKLLETHNACKKGINFFNTYFPNGVDIDKIKITGDYNNYWYFIRHLPEIKLDGNGNKIWEKDIDGTILEYKYDDNNNCILEKSQCGFIIKWKFTVGKDNHLTAITRNDKVICSIEYLD
jgi:hypothetical protein